MRARHAAAADLRAQLRPVACPPLAPELLVALGPLVAVGARGDGSGRPGSGWTVQLLQAGESVALLSAGDARALARDLSEMADVIEGRAE